MKKDPETSLHFSHDDDDDDNDHDDPEEQKRRLHAAIEAMQDCVGSLQGSAARLPDVEAVQDTLVDSSLTSVLPSRASPPPPHYGTKPGHLEIHFPTSEGVSKVSERASAAEGASEASSPEQANE